jgi:hypothetical protein
MRIFIEQAKALDIEFDYETSVKMAKLFDVGEALTNERARLDEIGLPTLVHDDLMAKIEDEFRMLATKYKCQKAPKRRSPLFLRRLAVQKAPCVRIANASNLAPASSMLVGLTCLAILPCR